MPSIADSTIALSGPSVEETSGITATPVASAASSGTVLRGVLPPSQVLSPVTVQAAKGTANSTLQLGWQPQDLKGLTAPAATPPAMRPEAPSIVDGSFVSSTNGYSFLFNVEVKSVNVAGYNVYRSTSVDFTGATRIQYISQPLTNQQTLQVTDPIPQSSTINYVYWVTAVSSAGLESAPNGIDAAGPVGIPQEVTAVYVAEAPYKTNDGQLLSLIAVDFTPVADDPFFESVNIYFEGYNGNSEAQLMANASTSPAQFLCETTGETVAVVVVAVSATQQEASFADAPATWITLNGVTTAPPSPSIAQAQVALSGNTGWQFAFNVIGGLEFDQIQSYRIYHSETNEAPTNYFRTIPQPHTHIGQEVVQEITGDILFYWVSSVNTNGLESPLVAVPFTYIDPGSPPPNVNPVTTTVTYKPATVLNGWAANGHVGNYEGGGGLGTENWGLNNTATLAYANPGNAYDGNQSTAVTCSQAHTHTYAGCIWGFSAVPALPSGATMESASVQIVSQVSPTSGPVKGHADIWYSLDNGATWTKLYAAYSVRPNQTDTIALSAAQNLQNVQIMAFLDAHDDIAHSIYDISLSVSQTANAGPQQVGGLGISLNNGNAEVSWSGLTPLSRTDILNYQVYRALHGHGYINAHLQATITPAPPQATYTWTDTEGHDGTWDYWVIAENGTGYSPASESVTLQNATAMLYTNGATIESLRPAAAGADVTGQNISADTSKVNGLASNVVSTNSSGQQNNLIPDSDGKFGGVYWSASALLPLVPGAGADGGNGFVYTGTGNPSGYVYSQSSVIEVVPGASYTLSGYIDATAVTSSIEPAWTVMDPALTTQYAAINGATGTKGRPSVAFTVPAGVTQVRVLCDTDNCTVTSGGKLIFSNPQLEVGSIATAYKPNLLDGATGYMKAGSTQIDLSSDIHLNKTADNITYADGSVVESLKPAAAGADVTADAGLVFLQNPNFAAGNTGWGAQVGWGIVTCASVGLNAPPAGGTYVGWYSGTVTSALTNQQAIPCTAGNVISASGYMKASSPSCTGNLHIEIVFFNSSGTGLATPGSPQCAIADWELYRVVATAPAGTAYAYIRLAIYNPSTTNGWAVSGFTASLLANSLDEVPDGATYQRITGVSGGKASTTSIQAGAVNSSIAFQSTLGVSIASSGTTTIGTVTPDSAGGFCDIRAAFQFYSNASGNPVYGIDIMRAGVSLGHTTAMAYAPGVNAAHYVEAIDTNPDPSVPYTLTVTAYGSSAEAVSIFFVADHRKV